MKLGFALIGLLVLSVMVTAQRPQRGPKIEMPAELKAAFDKAKDLRFSGTRNVTVVRAGRIETHVEYVTKDGPNIRIEFDRKSPYAGQVIVETKEARRHYFPDRNEIRVYPSFGKRQFEGFRGTFRSQRGGPVHVETANGGVIAGLHCTRYELSDKDSNPIVQIYVEPHSGMITKRVVYDNTGSIAGSYEFTTISLNPKIQSNAFNIYRKGAKIVRPIDELRKLGKELSMPTYSLRSNSGYRLESVYMRDVRGSKVIVQNFGKEDSRITLFMTRSSLNPDDLKKYEKGELSSHVWTLNGVTLVLIGDQSEDRLRTLATQVQI